VFGHAAHYSQCWADGSKIGLEIRGQGHGSSDIGFWGRIDSRWKSEVGGICAKSSAKVNGKNKEIDNQGGELPSLIGASGRRELRDGLVIPRSGSIQLSDM
jgi:hypothetical protein